MDIEIIIIGDEISLGIKTDTNGPYLSHILNKLGIKVRWRTIVGDESEALVEALRTANERSQLIITTGGLGPTHDDITRKALSRAFNQQLILQEEVLQNIKDRFKKYNKIMPQSNTVQALVPKNAKIWKNEMGTAPGLCSKLADNKYYIALPGVPNELKYFSEQYLIPFIQTLNPTGKHYISRTLHTIGTSESALAELVSPIINKEKILNISFLASIFGIDITFYGYFINETKGKKELDRLEKELKGKLDDLLYGIDEENLEYAIGRLLQVHNKRLAIAESCTGGLIGHRITNIAGSSEYFERGIIAYSNQSKIDLLNVSPLILERYGAVSEQTAKAMAKGVRYLSEVDIGLSITGIAGPSGGTKEKPIGLVYIAISTHNDCEVKKFNLTGDRKTIKQKASQFALNYLRLYLMEKG